MYSKRSIAHTRIDSDQMPTDERPTVRTDKTATRWLLASIAAVGILAVLRLLEPTVGDWIWPDSFWLRTLILVTSWLFIYNRLGRLKAFRDLEAEANQALTRDLLEGWSKSWVHQEFMYVEPPIISPVRVEKCTVSKHGLRLELTFLPRPGFVHPRDTKVGGVSTRFDTVAITESSVTELNIPWTLYLDPSLVGPLTEFAAEQGTLLHSGDAEAWPRFRMLAWVLAEALGDEQAPDPCSRYRAMEMSRDQDSPDS